MESLRKCINLYESSNSCKDFKSAYALLCHHAKTATSCCVHLWGASGTAKRIQCALWVDDLRKVSPHMAVLVIDHASYPHNTTVRKYTWSFYEMLCAALKIEMHKENAEAAEDEEDGEDDDSAAEEEDDEVHFLPARAVSRRIVLHLQKAAQDGCPVMIVLYRLELCSRASKKVLYALLSHMADASSSTVFLTTTRHLDVELEKRIQSRFNPYCVSAMTRCISEPSVLKEMLTVLKGVKGMRDLKHPRLDTLLRQMSECGLGLAMLQQAVRQQAVTGGKDLAVCLDELINPYGPVVLEGLPAECLTALAGCVMLPEEGFSLSALVRALTSGDGCFPHLVNVPETVWRRAVLKLLDKNLLMSPQPSMLTLTMPPTETIALIMDRLGREDKKCFEQYVHGMLMKKKRRLNS